MCSKKNTVKVVKQVASAPAVFDKVDIFVASRASTDACAVVCVYNAKTDLERIVDGLSIDLADALKNGKVPPIEIPDTENGLTSPDFIQGRLQDAFDAAEAVAAARVRQEQHKANKAKKAAEPKPQPQPQPQPSA